MNLRFALSMALLVPALALGQAALPTKPEAAKPEAMKPEATKPEAKKPAAKAAAPGTIATVNGVKVPKARSDMLIQQQQGRGMQDNDQTRAMVREELVNREVVAQEAQRAGFAKRPEVQAQLDLARQEIIVGAYIRDWVRKHPVTDAEVQKQYDKAKAEAGEREYRARHILLENEDEAKAMIAELKKGGKFDELAQKNSKDPGSKERGGDLDWNVPQTFDKQFSDAMVKLEKGKYTETPVRTRFGFHVIQLDDVRPVKFPGLAEVKPRIQQQLVQNKVEELIRGLRAKAKVE
jgi:peptidyl-prolyl cis-trans isomerase C